MITNNNIKRLEGIVADCALKDYKAANTKIKRLKNGMIRKNPYTLSDETETARDMLKRAVNKNITPDDEEKIKAYLLKKLLFE